MGPRSKFKPIRVIGIVAGNFILIGAPLTFLFSPWLQKVQAFKPAMIDSAAGAALWMLTLMVFGTRLRYW